MKKYLTYLRFLSYLLCIIILSSHLLACTKKSDELTLKGDKISQSDSHGNKDKKVNEQPQSDKVYFGMWTGSRLLIDDFYKFNENENFKGDTTGEGYGKYGGDFRDLLKKYGMFDEQKSEYFFDEAKPEFSSFTTFKKGDKLFVSTSKGVYACEVNGFVIDLNYEVGAGTIFYPTLNLPKDAKPEDNEIVVCTYYSNAGSINRKGITNQQVIDEFKAYLLPKLKGVMTSEYDDKGNAKSVPLGKLTNDQIKLFNGSFTGAGKDEYLVSVIVQNDFTNFTSLVYILDGSGKVITEIQPLAVNNFTFSKADGIIDINGDGIMEVITEDGYYEGGGYNFQKYINGKFEVLTTGFVFGV